MPCDRTPDEDKHRKSTRRRAQPRARGQNLDPRPPNAFFRFRSTFNERYPSNKTAQSGEAGREWAKMSEEERRPYTEPADVEMQAWVARNGERKAAKEREARERKAARERGARERLARGRAPSPSPSPTVAGPSGWSGEADVALPYSSYHRPPASTSIRESMARGMASGSSHGGPSSLPFSSLSSASASTSRPHPRPRPPVPSASSSSASTSQSRPRRPPAPSSFVPIAAPRGMGGRHVQAPMGMGGNGIFSQGPYSGVDPWSQESVMRYPATSSAPAGPSGYDRHLPRHRNGNTNTNTNANFANINLPRFATHSAPVPSSSGSHSAVDSLVGGSGEETDWDAILSMLPPAGPSLLRNHYGQSGSGLSGSFNTNTNTNMLGLPGIPAHTSSGQHPMGPDLDLSILNMPPGSLAQTAAGPSQLPNHYLSVSGSGSVSHSSDATGISGLMAPTPSVATGPYQPHAGPSNADPVGISGLPAPNPSTFNVPTPAPYQYLPPGPNSASSIPFGLDLDVGLFDTPTTTTTTTSGGAGSSHSITPPSDAERRPSLLAELLSPDLVPPFEGPELGEGSLRQEDSEGRVQENVDWYEINFGFEG